MLRPPSLLSLPRHHLPVGFPGDRVDGHEPGLDQFGEFRRDLRERHAPDLERIDPAQEDSRVGLKAAKVVGHRGQPGMESLPPGR